MELLAPAGGIEQLKAAIAFGADAVYLAAPKFGMRARAANFAMDELAEVTALAHASNVAVYLTCNIMITESDLNELPAFFEEVEAAGIDALIIGDLGAFALAKKHAPKCELHVSTQASIANAEAAKMWHSLGARRIVCAREMTLSDIAKMRKEIPDDLQIETFVHGAQCMAMSGRCLISAYMAERSGNRGDCTQPCRWNYALVEETRPGQLMEIDEDDRGTYIMNAMDLNMIEHLDAMREAGVDSIKIEGRNKKAFYVATVVGAYRQALDGAPIKDCAQELQNISHRPYSTGFFFGEPKQSINYDGYVQETLHVGDVLACEQDAATGLYKLTLLLRNRFSLLDELELMIPRKGIEVAQFSELKFEGESVELANRAAEIYTVVSTQSTPPGTLIRKREQRKTARSIPGKQKLSSEN